MKIAKCTKLVYDGIHYTNQCDKPAKFRVWYGDGPVVPRCGTHRNYEVARGAKSSQMAGLGRK